MPATIQTILKPTRARALDTSGNNNHGQIYSGRALEFDGVSDNLTHTEISVTDFTIATWINLNAYGTSDSDLVGFFSDGTSSMLGVKDDDWIIKVNGTWANGFTIASLPLNLNTWYRLVYTRTGSTIKIYLNGIEGTTITSSGALDGAIAWDIIGLYGTNTPFNGMMSDYQMWNTGWSADDILYDYNNPEQLALNNGGTSLTNSNLKLWYPMNDGHRGQQSYILDASDVTPPNKNHATTVFYGDEEAVNGDMETFPTLHATNDDTFTDESVDGSQNITMVTEGTINNSGSKSAKCTLTSGVGRYVTYNKTDYVVGRTYRAEVYMRAGGSQTITAFQMFADDSIRGEDGTDGSAITPSESFAIAYVEFVAVATTMMINMKFAGTATHFAFIDDFSIKEIGTASGWTDADQQLDIPQTALQSYNQLAWFDGLNDRVVCNNGFTPGTWTTVAFWVFINGADGESKGFFECLQWETSNFRITANANNKISLHIESDGVNTPYVDSRTTITRGKWIHICVTVPIATSTVGRMYINGEGQDYTTSTEMVPASRNIYFMYGSGLTQEYTSGSMTEISIWDAQLTDSEVNELYNDGKAFDALTHSDVGNLTAYWKNNGLAQWDDLKGSDDGVITCDETMLITAGVDGSRDSQGFLMNSQRATNSLNLTSFAEDDPSPFITDHDHVKCPSFNPSDNYDVFSICGWIKAKVISENQFLIDNRYDGNTGWVVFASDTSGNFKFKIGDGTDELTLDSGANLTLDTWHHLVCTYAGNAGAMKMYFDGVYKNTGNATDVAVLTSLSNLQNIQAVVGARSFDNNENGFHGQIDDVLFYSKVLSDGGVSDEATAKGEIARIYNAGKRSHR